MLKKSLYIVAISFVLTACGSTPDRMDSEKRVGVKTGSLSLPDKTAFLQNDKRWAREKLGPSSDTIGKGGCLVTATAMALGNLGFETDPSDLNRRLTATNSYTKRGHLIWNGIEKVTGGKANARYYTSVTPEAIDGCLRDGYYPMTRFYLPNGRSHWAMIVGKSDRGFHMRDPLRDYKKPLIFPRGSDAFKSLRCIGVGDSGKA